MESSCLDTLSRCVRSCARPSCWSHSSRAEGGAPSAPADGGADGAVPDAFADMYIDPVIDVLDRCGATEHYVVRAVTMGDHDCIGGLPAVGEAVRLVRDDGGARLLYDRRELTVVDAAGACAVRASACVTDAVERGDVEQLDAELAFEGDAARLRLSASVFDGFRPEQCSPAEVALAPVEGDCALVGRYTLDAPLTLTGGECSVEWSADAASIVLFEAPDAFDVLGTFELGGAMLDITAVDRGTCTASGERFALSNGAARTTRFEVSVSGDRVEVVIEDAIDGSDDLGNTCVDARFEGAGARPALAEEPDPAMCPTLPYVCGDGICAVDLGESCVGCAEDCGCEAGTACLRFTPPESEGEVAHCSRECGEAACPAGERCLDSSRYRVREAGGAPVFNSDWCFAVPDARPLGSVCDDEIECEATLGCGYGLCLPYCDDVGGAPYCGECSARLVGEPEICMPDCDPGERPGVCGEAHCVGRASGYRCVAEFCESRSISFRCSADPAPGYGEPCAGRTCEAGLRCVSGGCTAGRDCDGSWCSRRCEGDGDCAEPMPRCLEVTEGRSYCFPPLGGG